MFNWFFKKKEIREIKEEAQKGFDLVKKDINHVGEWIKHLDSEKENHKKEIKEIKDVLSTMKEDIEKMKNTIFISENLNLNRVFKTPKQVFKKQTAVYGVQTAVQTGVQTPFFDQFSVIERSILWVLINTDMKLSYEDIAAILRKEKTTIRGQINTIKQKSEGVIQETIEKNGKKRIFISKEVKERIMENMKVRVKKNKKKGKNEE